MLDVLNVTKSYHGIPAVRTISISTGPGDVVGLLGPNGSGKSTTVKMIVGLLPPTRGQIHWRGQNIHDQLISYQEIVGYVPEEHHDGLDPAAVGLDDVLTCGLLQLLAGWTLIEVVLTRWSKIPFACAHAPSPSVLKAWWPAYGVAIYVYAFRLSDWQFAALTSTRALFSYVVTLLVVIGIVRVLRYRRFRHDSLQFDAAPSHSMERLNLSEAVD